LPAKLRCQPSRDIDATDHFEDSFTAPITAGDTAKSAALVLTELKDIISRPNGDFKVLAELSDVIVGLSLRFGFKTSK
jgi:hypothetical protein